MNKFSRISTRFGGALLLAILALGVLSAAAAAAPLITITKSDSLLVDIDGDGQADAGDTLRYTIVITNNGTEALSVTVADTLDANLLFVPGSLKISPIAIDDAANVLGNVSISQAAPGVLGNDFDPDGGTLVALAASGSSVQGGDFSINADGSFSYNPPAGYEGADSFDYTIQDPDGMTSTGTVNLTISGMLWFINNNAPACVTQCGRLSSPFNSMVAFNTANTGAGNNPAAGDSIFVYESGNPYSGPLTLLNNQRLVGQDASQSLLSLTGLTAPSGSASLPAMNTGAPGVTITSGASGLVLGQNNHLYGFSMGNTSGAAIQGSNFGTLSVRDVSINTSGPALSLNSGGFAAAPNNAFLSITSSGGANNVSLTGVTGTGSLGSGALSGATSHALVVDGGNGSLTYSGTINNTSARPLLVQNKTGGSINLSGAITGSAQGILLNNNTGATINLSGLLTLNTGTNAAFTATGGGTLSATHASNTITTTSGQAVNINGTSIGGGGVIFLRINANGGSNAITLTNAGSGGFTVTGVGTTDGSGGTIQNITQRGISIENTNNITLSNLTLNAANTTDAPGSCDYNTNTGCYAAVYLNTVNNATLNNVDISNSAQTGINGLGVSNFTYTNGIISSSGSSANEDGIDLRNLSGVINLTNSSINTSGERGLLVRNNSGTISAFTITNLTVNGASLGDGALIDLQAGGSANATINVTSSTFTNAFSEGLQVNNEGSGTAAVRVSSSTFTNNNIGVNLSTNYNAVLNYNISGNTFTNARQAVNVSNVAAAPGAPYMEGSISNNQISATNSAAIALWVVQEGNGQITTKIENNTITQFGDTGIDVQSRGGSGRVDATINGNTVNFGVLNFELAGIFLASGNGTPGETNTICVNLNGNNVSAGGMALGDYTIDRFSSPSTRFYIQGLAPSPTNISGNNVPPNPVGAYLLASNTATTVGQEYFINDGAYSAQNCATVTFSAEPVSPVLGQAEPATRLGSLTASLNRPDAPAALGTEKTLHNAASKMTPAVFVSPSRVNSGTPSGGLFSSLAAPLADVSNINLGTLPAGESITIIFDASITNPLAAGANQISNQASVSGSNFTTLLSDDPDTAAPSDPTLTNVSAAPDLTISKSDGGISAQPGDTITYTLSYTNAGTQGASGVVLTEIVPANTTFNPGASTAGWACLPNNNAGSTCSLITGGLNGGGANGSASFAVNVVNPLPAGVSQVSNSAQIGDDGTNGADPTPANNSASDTTPVDAAPDLTISKSDGGISAQPGSTITYTLSYTNVGTQGASGVLLTEIVPANTTFSPGASTAGWICLPNNNAGSICSLITGGLNGGGANGSASFAVNVVTPLPESVNQVSNSAQIDDDGANGADPTPANNISTDTTPVDAAPDLTISKSDGGTSAQPGGTITYTLSYTNAGTQGASGVVLTEIVPANTTFNPGASTAGWACLPNNNAGSTCSLITGGLNGGGANGSASFAVNVVNLLPAGVSQVSNSAQIGDDGTNGTDPTPANNSASDTTPVDAAPDLTISKSDGGISTQPGSTITYTLSYTNTGTQGASGVLLTEIVPANTTFSPGASTAGWICLPNNNAGSICSLAAGSLNGGGANGSASFAVNVVTPLPAGVSQVSNSAQVGDDGANGADPTPANNSASDTTPVDAAPDLVLGKDDGVTQFLPGDTITYTLNYTNTGNQDAAKVMLTETVPANTTFNPGASTPGWICLPDNLAGSTCSLAIGSLNGGSSGSALFAVTVSSPASGVDLITNTASIGDDGSNGADPTPANNSATETTPLANQPPMLLNLALSSPVDEGSMATLTGELNDPNLADTFVLNVDWGDGFTNSVTLLAGTSTFNLTHFFIDDNPSISPSDVYTVVLELLDSVGNADTAALTTTVNNVDPQLIDLAISPVIDEMGVVTLTGYLEDLGMWDTFTLTVDWGDGITQTVAYTGEVRAIDLTHQYLDDNPSGTAFDTYNVMLNLVDDDSGSTSATLTTQVNNLAPVLTNLAVTPAINEAETVTLTANLSDTGVLDTFEVLIDWGDGLSDTLALPAGTTALTATHLYADDDPPGTSADTYHITVSVSDDDGGLDSASTSTLVNNIAPALSLLVLTPAIDEGGWATLSGTILDPGMNDVITLSVDWGDGVTGVYTYSAMAAAINLTHQYVDDDPSGTPADGYTLTLSAMDDDLGSSSDSSLALTVNNLAPVLSGVSLTPSINEGGAATLSGSWTDPGLMDTFTLTVDWGDGSQEIFTYPAGTASFSESHSYADDNPSATAADSYSVQYTLADDDSGQAGGSLAVMVNNTAPQLSELAISTPIMEGGLATLSGQMADPGVMDTFTLTVDWGDGSQEAFSYPAGATSFSLDHNYLDDDPSATPADLYLVEVTLNDDDLGQAEDSLSISVTNVAPLVWAGPDQTAQIPNSITFTGVITDPGMLDSFTMTWDFGDGTAPQSGTLSPSHTYAQPGVYTATLQVTDDDGGVGQDTARVYVTGLTDLSITKVGAPDPVLSGNLLVYTLTVTNHEDFPAVGVTVTDTLPANVSFISATPGCLENGQVVCNLGTVGANTSLTITITVLVNLPSGSLINNAVVGAASDDPNPANNSATWVTNVVSSLLVIDDDFENGSDPRWCDTRTSVSPSGRGFLGQYGNQNVCLLLSDLPTHAEATISFDLYIIRSWDGNESAWSLAAEPFSPSGFGPDTWSLEADGQELLVTTFANWDQYDFLQSYPGTVGAGSFPARYGAEENNTLGYEFGGEVMDAVYHVTFTIPHTDDELLLDFAAWGLQALGDESWGLDNVQVHLSAAPSQPNAYRIVFPLVMR